MKHTSKLILLAILMLTFWSCKKAENKVSFQGGTAPVLSSTVTDTIRLSFANKDNQAITLSWTNPDYKFTTGLSSQDVNYLLEIDTAGANFSNPKRAQISVSNDLSTSFTVAALNDLL